MKAPSVSLHPYFKIHPGKMDTAKALLPAFVTKTQPEALCLGYEFTCCGDEIFCREAYQGAEGVLAHLANVDALLKELLTSADLVRLEIHGPEAELEKLREPLSGLQPRWFSFVCGRA